ncbi:F-actin capping [Kwoniella heveanensis CBS 569]|uniref:F-actin capping n=1 Tax=Kwoniella heveanensis BCC8398 TaxID=1296120 RepID=A0A1B9H016_9TREE|nr:F-actin capping [Kwoniella heveanensis BCC8398]OCF45404.1 F-actin capping [Kwoniella heveanensis CBS 569]
MADLSLDEKCKLAAGFVEQTPPGEINDVINDIRAIISDDDALMTHVLPALRSYNLSQLHVIDHQASGEVPAHSSLLSDAAILPGSDGSEERYVDTEGKRSFAFDHVTLVVSDYQPYELPEEEESFRSALAKSLAAYTKNHFATGYSSVSTSQFPVLPPASEPTAPATATEPTAAVTAEEPSTATDEPSTGAAEPSLTATAGEPSETEPEPEPEPEPETVTDVIEEQVGTGDLEPAPTPAAGGAEVKKDEIVRPESLDQLDELVEEAKEEEESGEKAEHAHKPAVDEVPAAEPEEAEKTVEPASAQMEQIPKAPALEKRQQQRVENPTYTLEIVGNKYNPNNFWTGRWRTRWIVDKAAGKVSGTINVDVHYYEQGNVQLATEHDACFPLPTEENGSQSIASQIVTTISKIETAYHLELNDVYGELGDKAFRA